MGWFSKLFSVNDEIIKTKDVIVEHSNGVRLNYTLYGRIIAAKRANNEVTNLPNFTHPMHS